MPALHGPPRKTAIRRPVRGQSPEKRQQERRERLIAAGIEMFGTQGYHAVRVRDVCRAARLTERYFYESFRNLEALFLAVYEHGVERIRVRVMAALERAPTSREEVTRHALRAYLETLQSEPRLARILLIDVLTVGEDVAQQSRLATQSFAYVVKELTLRFEPSFAESQLDPLLVANGLIGATVYMVMQWAFEGFKEPLEHVLEHCAIFYDALALYARREESERARRFSA
jgi:AcrR family transcriptional regulator